jgi:hypothetical protein
MTRDYARFPADENGDALCHMAEAGDDLGKPREVDFAVIFPTEAAARQFAVHLLRDGQKVSFGPYDGDPDRPWQVHAHRVLLPTHAAITAVETDLAHDAAPLGGRNDGWGCLAQDQTALPVVTGESGRP